jgi:hypothetical protein
LIWPKATSARDKFTFDGFSRTRALTARSASESRVSLGAAAGFRLAILDVIPAKSSSRFATLT